MRMRMHMRINYIIKIYTKVKSNQNSTSSIKARHVQQYLTLRIRTLCILQSISVRRGLATLIITTWSWCCYLKKLIICTVILCMHVYVYLTRTYASSVYARVCIRTRANARICIFIHIYINAFTRGCFDTNVRKHDRYHIMMYVRVHVRACVHIYAFNINNLSQLI